MQTELSKHTEKDVETDMTERTLKTSLTAEMVENILFDIKDMSANILTDEEREKLNAFEAKIEPMVEAFGLMNKATVLYDDERVTLFEHPTKGDEAPVMAYFKKAEIFAEDTGEFDADAHTADIILEDQREWTEDL